LFGIVLGWLGSEAISSQFGMPLIVEMQTVLIAVAVSVSVGFYAGVWPAYIASKLDPIEALRHD
jgi:putative ABC transport system permease protein